MHPTAEPAFWGRQSHLGASARCCNSKVWVLMKSRNHTPSHASFCNCPQFSYPNFLGRPQGFLLNNSQVEGTREDENQQGSRRGSWKREQTWVLHHWTENQSGAPAKESLWGGSCHSEPSCTKGSLCRQHSWRTVDGQTLISVLGAQRDTCYWEGFFEVVEISACQLVKQGQIGIPRVGWHWKAGNQKESGWSVPKKCLLSAQQSLAWRPGYKRQEGANQLQKPHGGTFLKGTYTPESSSTSEALHEPLWSGAKTDQKKMVGGELLMSKEMCHFSPFSSTTVWKSI